MDGQEETAAVNVTGTLTIDGELAIGNVNMTVAEGAKVIVNRSLITDANDSAKIVVNGTLETGTGAEITLNQATMTVNGTCEIAQESSIFVNDGSAMTVNGTLNNYGWFHVGFYADEAETAGLLFVNGTMNNYNYLNVVKKDVLVNEDDPDEVDYSGGVVNVTATGILNICADENHWGFMEHHGELNIEGQVKVDAGLDICPEGTVTVKSGGSLINNDTVKIYGNMDIYGTVTNNMQFWMEDSEDGMAEPMVTGYEGSEFINNTSVWNRSASGVLDLSNTAYTHGYIEIEGSRENAELCQRYFSDDHLSDVTVNGMENEDIYLVYEGGVESLIRGVYAYGEAKGYKGSTARVVGNVVLNSDLTIGSGDTLVVMRGEYLTLNSGMTLTLTENGMLNLTPGAVLTVNTGAAIDNQGRFITNAGYGEWADSVIYQNGVLTNSGDMTIMGDIRGMCGTGLSWIVENEILTISGSGAMISYENAAGVPWNALKITKVELSEGITSISAYAFANIGSVTVRIPRSVETIGSNAFGAEMALEVYCKSAALTYAKTNSLKYTEIHNMVDDTCADCGYTEKELFEIDFVSMVLQNSLMMRFAFPANSAEDWTGAYAVATKTYADGTANVSQRVEFADWNSANINGAAHYHFAFDEIAGKEMSDEIYVTVYNADGDAISKEYVETVRSYVMRMLAKDTTAASVKAMMVDMLNYGAAAQNTFSYATDDLANSQLSDEQKGYGSADMQACTDIRIKGANYQGSRLLLESSINFQMAFAGLTEEMTANISFTDHYGNVQNYTVNPIKMESSGTVVVSIDQIVVADARRPITVTVYDTNGQVYGTATDSIESYVARMTSGGDPLYEMVIKFADSAYAYMHP